VFTLTCFVLFLFRFELMFCASPVQMKFIVIKYMMGLIK